MHPLIRLLPRAVGGQGQRQASFLGGIFGAGEKKNGIATEATFDWNPYKLHKLDDGPATSCTLDREEALRIYREMVTVRRMETAAANLYKEKQVRGFCHLCSGQEAIYTGMKAGIREQDSIITSYRAHGFTYVMGVPVLGVLAELCGKKSGVVRGKGGSMHMYAKNFYGGNGIVGAQVPLGAGIALANKYLDNKTISIAAYGDGAANQGQVFEAYNIAKLWNLPVIFVCENNHYGMGTSSERSSASNKYYTRGDYVPGIWVDGMDFVAVKEATSFARDYVLNNGPIVMEMETYRYHGHSMSDPDTTYRSREEKETTRKTRDPILLLSQKIESSGWATAAEIKALEKSIRKSVKEESEAALASPEPPMELLGKHIYSGDQPSSIRGCDVTLTISP